MTARRTAQVTRVTSRDSADRSSVNTGTSGGSGGGGGDGGVTVAVAGAGQIDASAPPLSKAMNGPAGSHATTHPMGRR